MKSRALRYQDEDWQRIAVTRRIAGGWL